MPDYDNNILQYLNGYLEFISGFNSSLSSDYNYAFGMQEVDEENFELPATRTPIRFTQFQQAAAKWFAGEMRDEKWNEAIADAAENFLEIIEIELIRNRPIQFFMAENDKESSLFILESETGSFWVEFAKEEKE